MGLLAYQEHVYSAQIEIVVERQRGETAVSSMGTSIELQRGSVQTISEIVLEFGLLIP